MKAAILPSRESILPFLAVTILTKVGSGCPAQIFIFSCADMRLFNSSAFSRVGKVAKNYM